MHRRERAERRGVIHFHLGALGDLRGNTQPYLRNTVLSGRYHKFDDEIECTAENAESAEALSIFISALSAISAVIRNHTCETQYLASAGPVSFDRLRTSS